SLFTAFFVPATKYGLYKSLLLYFILSLSGKLYIFKPDAKQIACPAALSHSMVGENRKYNCISPVTSIIHCHFKAFPIRINYTFLFYGNLVIVHCILFIICT